MRITNFKLRITNAGFWFRSSLFFCLILFFSTNVFTQSLEIVTQIIERGNVEQKRDALLQIRNLQTAEASRVALPALKDSSEIVRAAAAFSVIFTPKDEAVRNLTPLLADKKPLVRREAAYALGKVGDAVSINPLLTLFQKDKVLEVRNAAIVALGEIGDVSVIPELTKILQKKPSKKEDFLRRSAARSVGQIAQIIQTGVREVVTPENRTPLKNEIVEPAKNQKLNNEFSFFQPAAQILIQVLRNADEADDVRREAAFALGAIGDETSIAVLQSNFNAEDYYLAQICREALAKIEDKISQANAK